MQYKTIIFELLQQRPQMHDQLRKSRKLLPTLELYARELKTSHEAWKEMLSQTRPGSDPSQIASEALEMALKEMEDRLPSASPQDGNEALFLDAAMAFLRRHYVARLKASRNQPTLFDSLSDDPTSGQAGPACGCKRRHSDQLRRAATETRFPPEGLPPSVRRPDRQRRERPRPATSSPPSARLKTIEQEQRPATPEEKQIARPLRRLRAGRPVDLPRSGHRPLQGCRLAGPRRGTEVAADARGIRQRQTHHLQRLLHVADRHRRHPRGHRPPGRARQRHDPGTRLRHRQFHEPGPARACASSASSWIPSPAASPERSTPARTSASRTSATPSCPRTASTR